MSQFANNCPFCDIVKNDPKNQIIKRGTYVTAIRKLYKSNSVNFLIVSNNHIVNLKTGNNDTEINNILSEMRAISNELSGNKDWSIKINSGANAAQSVFHLHAHISSHDKPWDTLGKQ